MSKNFPGCEDCWHSYHCPMPQEGYDYDPKTCPWNPDNDKSVVKKVYDKTMGGAPKTPMR